MIEVKKGTNKPYFLSSTGLQPNGTYIRVGGTIRQANENEILTMIRDYSDENYESEVSANQNLHFSYASLYYQLKKKNLMKEIFYNWD